jgi:membrane protein required for colicin V production
MAGMTLTWFDLIVVIIILISSIMAFARGLLREVFSIVAFIGAAIAALYLRGALTPLLSNFIHQALFAEMAAAVILFLGVFVVVTVATSSLAKAIHRSGEIGALDRGAGLIFGAARGVLALALFVVLWHHITGPSAPMPDWLAKARTYPVLNVAANGLEAFVPKAQDYINERRRAESATPT